MKTCIITTSPSIDHLIELAGTSSDVTAVVVGARDAADLIAAAGISVSWVDAADAPAESYAASVAEMVAGLGADLLLAPDVLAARVLLGAAAAKSGAVFIGGLASASADGCERNAFGGIVEQEISVAGGRVASVADGGQIPAPGNVAAVTPVASSPAGMRMSCAKPLDSTPTDLNSAIRIVSAGRGFKNQEDLQLAKDLSAALDAALACSRPLAEGLGWMPKDAYVGISGHHVSPDLYVTVGISGQLQHMSGANGAGCVVAINSDAKAPVFAQADYGIVGDLYEILPALTQALK